MRITLGVSAWFWRRPWRWRLAPSAGPLGGSALVGTFALAMALARGFFD